MNAAAVLPVSILRFEATREGGLIVWARCSNGLSAGLDLYATPPDEALWASLPSDQRARLWSVLAAHQEANPPARTGAA